MVFIAMMCEDPEDNKFTKNNYKNKKNDDASSTLSGEFKKHCFHWSWSVCGMRSLETTPISFCFPEIIL